MSAKTRAVVNALGAGAAAAGLLVGAIVWLSSLGTTVEAHTKAIERLEDAAAKLEKIDGRLTRIEAGVDMLVELRMRQP
ncbi:MAG: hypothetical protein WC789_10730 [Lentisphaeria bacterium]